MKKKVLIIFKYPHVWNSAGIDKFSNYYDTEYLYISDYKNKNFAEIIYEINNLIKLKDIKIVFFDVDYFKFINFFFIEKINSEKKILWTGDDFELHEMNAITASSCDLVLSHCPLSVLKYREKGYKAHILHGVDGKINKSNDNKKEIDVLFFGNITPDRKEILDYIANEGISLKNVGHEEHIVGLPKEELLKLISKSKIVVNSAGLWCDAVSKMVGIDDYKLHICKGEYYKTTMYRNEIHSLIYPLPTAISLGTHIILHLDGTIGFGPNAYYVDKIDYSMDDSNKKTFLKHINKYLDLPEESLSQDFAGIRPKIQGPGEPTQDFIIINEKEKGYHNFINLIGIESPGLTSSLAIAEYVKEIID